MCQDPFVVKRRGNKQLMQMVGVIAAALVIPLVLNSLLIAYGMGAPTPENPNSLTAPQATLMMSVATGIFGGSLPWNMVYIGGAIGITIIIIDQYLKSRNSSFRMPVLAVAVGLYLPFELDSAIFVGGILAYFVNKSISGRAMMENAKNAGLLLASGLITGEALMGIIIAIAIVAGAQFNSEVLGSAFIHENIGLLILLVIIGFIYYSVNKVSKDPSEE